MVFFGLLGLHCADIDRTIHRADDTLLPMFAEYDTLAEAHRLVLAGEDEPGERLFVMGRLVKKEDGAPLAHQTINLYQADDTGSYDETVTGDESTARLNGVVETDSLGRFIISTVLPGDYGSRPNNRHIHTAVTGARPEAYDFYFRQYMNRGLISWAENSDQAMILDLYEMGNGDLITAGDLVVKEMKTE